MIAGRRTILWVEVSVCECWIVVGEVVLCWSLPVTISILGFFLWGFVEFG